MKKLNLILLLVIVSCSSNGNSEISSNNNTNTNNPTNNAPTVFNSNVIDNTDGTVTIVDQGLTWTKCTQIDVFGHNSWHSVLNDCSNGYPYAMQVCNINNMCDDTWGTMLINQATMTANGTFSDVYSSCKNLSLAGGGWRLPTINEMEALTPIYQANTNLFGYVDYYYWSGTGYNGMPQYGWAQAAYNVTNGSYTTPIDMANFPAHVICVK